MGLRPLFASRGLRQRGLCLRWRFFRGHECRRATAAVGTTTGAIRWRFLGGHKSSTAADWLTLLKAV